MKIQTRQLNRIWICMIALCGICFVSNAEAKTSNLSDEIVQEVNIERQKQGKDILKRSEALDKAAALKARDMIGNNYFAHTSPSGIDPWHWIGEVDYQYKYAGENLAMDFKTAKAVHGAWMNSETHKENIIADKYTEIGVAVVRGIIEEGKDETNVAVQYFATPFMEEGAAEKLNESEKDSEISKVDGENIDVIEASVRPWEGVNEDEMLIYAKIQGEVESVMAYIGKDSYQMDPLSDDRYMGIAQIDKEKLKVDKVVVKVQIDEKRAIFHQIPKYQYLEYLEKEDSQKQERKAVIASVKSASNGLGNSLVTAHNIILAGFVLVCMVMIANVWILEKEEEKLLRQCQENNLEKSKN